MRGEDVLKESLFTTIQLESFVPSDHPLRPIRILLDQAMQNLNWLFDSIYADRGRESIPPERLIRAQLLQVLFSICSERQLVEQINYNLLYRWFVGLTVIPPIINRESYICKRLPEPAVFSNRDNVGCGASAEPETGSRLVNNLKTDSSASRAASLPST